MKKRVKKGLEPGSDAIGTKAALGEKLQHLLARTTNNPAKFY
ncbi:hypothetical protein [Bradyrhizobium sp. dw_78]|nr:hypothetical protein [Bradyrhizobium sp. dw_78]